jgi:peptide/nickel transport system permease protein
MPTTLVRRETPPPPAAAEDAVLEIAGLKTEFHVRDRVYRAVGGVDLSPMNDALEDMARREQQERE